MSDQRTPVNLALVGDMLCEEPDCMNVRRAGYVLCLACLEALPIVMNPNVPDAIDAYRQCAQCPGRVVDPVARVCPQCMSSNARTERRVKTVMAAAFSVDAEAEAIEAAWAAVPAFDPRHVDTSGMTPTAPYCHTPGCAREPEEDSEYCDQCTDGILHGNDAPITVACSYPGCGNDAMPGCTDCRTCSIAAMKGFEDVSDGSEPPLTVEQIAALPTAERLHVLRGMTVEERKPVLAHMAKVLAPSFDPKFAETILRPGPRDGRPMNGPGPTADREPCECTGRLDDLCDQVGKATEASRLALDATEAELTSHHNRLRAVEWRVKVTTWLFLIAMTAAVWAAMWGADAIRQVRIGLAEKSAPLTVQVNVPKPDGAKPTRGLPPLENMGVR